MGKLHRVIPRARVLACALVCAFACACTKEREPAPAPRKALEHVALAPPRAAVDERFDSAGNLKASARRVGWLEIPAGFDELAGSTAHMASFEAKDMPYDKALSYFDARLVPKKLEPRQQGMSFRFAKPSHTELAVGTMHVTVLEVERASQRVRVHIDDLSADGPTLSVDEASKELARERTRMR